MNILINAEGNLQAIHYNGGLIFEHKKNDVNGAFTCFSIQGTLLYCGTEKGPVVVFDLLKGNFVKQIPFPSKIFDPYNYRKNAPSPSVAQV